jgi:hypothetical protein
MTEDKGGGNTPTVVSLGMQKPLQTSQGFGRLKKFQFS